MLIREKMYESHFDPGLAQNGRQCLLPGLQTDQRSEQDPAGVHGRIPAHATVGQLHVQLHYVSGEVEGEKEKGQKTKVLVAGIGSVSKRVELNQIAGKGQD